MSDKYSVGSTWRKWDLHVHTPASVVQDYGGNTDDAWEKFFQDLEKLPPEFKVIGINDYIFVDGYEKVLAAKASGRLQNIDMILPVVELRLDKFCGVVKKEGGAYSKSDWNRINLHVIFDQLPAELIRQQFLNGLSPSYTLIPDSSGLKSKWQAVITPQSLTELGQMVIDAAPAAEQVHYASPLQEGFNNLCISLEKVKDALKSHQLEGRYVIAIGKAEWDNMKWNDQSIAEKRNVIGSADLVFSACENPAAYDKARAKLKESNVLDRLLDCSDAHTFSDNTVTKDRIGQCFTWIKADPTFAGLKQAITEFDQRVFVGDTPPKQLLIKSNRTKYISSVRIRKKEGSALSDPWFNVDIPLNADLVAIIGNKGSGKSALADAIALIGDTKNFADFSFLTAGRFRDPKTKLSAHFSGQLAWEDQTTSDKELHLNPLATSIERVKYLPQSYLEKLCNELTGTGATTFDGELRKIIYTHVPPEQQIGVSTLDDLIAFKISQLEGERTILLEDLSRHNTKIVEAEARLAPSFKVALETQLDAKKKELSALDSAKPQPVENPAESADAKAESDKANAVLSEKEAVLNEVKKLEEAATQKRADAVRGSAHVARILQALKNHQQVHQNFLDELGAMLLEISAPFAAADIATLTVTPNKLLELSAKYAADAKQQDALLSPDNNLSLPVRRRVIEADIQVIKNQLGEKQRQYIVYRDRLAAWEKSKADLQGDKDKPNTIAGLQSAIDDLDALPAKLDELRSLRQAVVRNLHRLIQKMVEEYKVLYQPVQQFVASAPQLDIGLPLAFDVRIAAKETFQRDFLERINRSAKGSFSGIEESNVLMQGAIAETDFNDEDAVVAFSERMDDLLHFDRRQAGVDAPAMLIPDQLRSEQHAEELYDLLFGLTYLAPQYSLTYQNQEISQLSPGERGLLLLVFYLLVDKDDIPLLIDQPEENLDNQTIFKILVQCIKAAKQKRQVIMVTHNPNLAVVCDAEQIICASCDKTAKRFDYVSGAIESAEIRNRVIEILEGTQPAFVNRRDKYGLRT